MSKWEKRGSCIAKVVQMLAFLFLIDRAHSIGIIVMLIVFGVAAYAQGLLEGGAADG